MQLVSVESDDSFVHATFSDGTRARYPHIWLRDNDPAGFHPETHERTFDLTKVPLDVRPQRYAYTPDALTLHWSKSDLGNHVGSDVGGDLENGVGSRFSAAWLHRHRPGQRRVDHSDVRQRTWTAESLGDLPRFCATKCREQPSVLAAMLVAIKRDGIVVIENLEDHEHAGERFGDLIGFKRETNFGVMFEVVNKPDPNNLAYTALALPLHTDLANQELVPGVQFLHCIANTSEGGDSVFADGFQIGHDMANEEPELFATLKDTDVPWRFFDQSCDIVSRYPVIQQREDGQFEAFTFNAHIADIPDLEPDRLMAFYTAYQNIMKRIRSPRYRVEYRLQAGEMIVMANRRVLHGRTAFDPDSGYRHLRGYYIEMNEINSRLRVLARTLTTTTETAL